MLTRTILLIVLTFLVVILLVALYYNTQISEGFSVPTHVNNDKILNTMEGVDYDELQQGLKDREDDIIQGSSDCDHGKRPEPVSIYFVPRDLPGATSANPTESLASVLDIKATLDLMNIYRLTYENNMSKYSTNKDYVDLYKSLLILEPRLQKQIDSGNIVETYSTVRILRDDYEKGNRAISQGIQIPAKPAATKKNNVLTQRDIEIAIDRALEEKNRIDLIITSSPPLRKRSQNLEKVIQDLQEYLGKLIRYSIDIEDLPFTKRDIDKFLGEVDNKSSLISTLPQDSNNQSSEIKENVRNLGLEIIMSLDPNQDKKTSDRVNKILDGVDFMSNSDLKNILQELQITKQRVSTHSRRSLARSSEDIMANQETAYYPTPMQQAIEMPVVISPEWNSRLGYEPTDEIIAKRAKAASYDHDDVKGVDYFKRVQFLCNQIKSAELGEPSEFGCLDPKADVSPEYSWRGNYKMVCSRLGNIWGGWYPEMFGCPKSDVSTSMVPDLKVTS